MNKKLLIGILVIIVVIVFLILSSQEEKKPVTHLSVNESIKSEANIGVVVTFPGEISEWTAENIETTYQTVKNAGIKTSNVYFTWGEIESKQGTYNWGDLDFNIYMIDKHKIKVSLEIKLIDTNQIGALPNDTAFTSFDDSLLKERFKAFILELLDRYEGRIDYLWIGNEIDDYFYNHRDQLDSYISLYNETYFAVKAKYPKVKVGTISTYHDAKNNQAIDIIEKVGKTGDIIGFSLYPQIMNNAASTDIDVFFNDMSSIADKVDKKFAITETGWSTRGFGGSEAKQKEYIQRLFKAFEEHADKTEFLSLFVLYDLPESINKEIAKGFGLEEHKEFIEFQGSLGLVYNNGKPKEAWNVFLEEMKKLEK